MTESDDTSIEVQSLRNELQLCKDELTKAMQWARDVCARYGQPSRWVTLGMLLAEINGRFEELEAAKESWRRLAVDLTRCEHGRVQDDNCFGCPDSVSPNQSGRTVGNSLHGTSLVMIPPRQHMADVLSWYVPRDNDGMLPGVTVRVNIDLLRQHLYDMHKNMAAHGLSFAEALDQHYHEHFGPGGLRNHGHIPELEPFKLPGMSVSEK